MKQYEIRTKDLKRVVYIPPSELVELDPECYFDTRFSLIKDRVLVLHEWESPAEADAARLDWIAEHPTDASRIHRDFDTLHWRYNAKGDFRTHRELIDKLRQAPQPKVTVIATPDGPVDPA